MQKHLHLSPLQKVEEVYLIDVQELKTLSVYSYHSDDPVNKDFLCSTCNKTFDNESDLNRHHKLAHKSLKKNNAPDFNCTLCDRVFKSLHNFNQHIKAHAAKDDKICPHCQKSFQALNSHIKNVHLAKQFFCGFEGCDKSFAKKNGLDRHLKTHSDDFKQFQCPDCSRMFVEKVQLERHYQVHLKNEKKTNHRCPKCLKYFNRNADLVRHTKTVHEEKQFECDKCPARRFGTRFEVLRHFKTVHLRERCKRNPARRIPIDEILSNSFIVKQENDDDDDLEIEQLAKSTFAIEAAESLTGDSHLKEILERVETIEAVNGCSDNAEYLEEEFSGESAAQEVHVEIVRPTTRQLVEKFIHWECQRCNRNFETCERLKLHNLRNHNWKCKLCPGGKSLIDVFHRREDFELHWMDNHGSERFPDKIKCFVCLDMFADTAAVHTHQKYEHGMEPPIRRPNAGFMLFCHNCLEEFKSPGRLKKHLEQVHRDQKLRKCFTCNLQFKFFDDFRAHVGSHSNHFVCLVCGGKPFQDLKSLKIHQRMEHDGCRQTASWECDLCGSSFNSKKIILRHISMFHHKRK